MNLWDRQTVEWLVEYLTRRLGGSVRGAKHLLCYYLALGCLRRRVKRGKMVRRTKLGWRFAHCEA
jgi:hypothetical protein